MPHPDAVVVHAFAPTGVLPIAVPSARSKSSATVVDGSTRNPSFFNEVSRDDRLPSTTDGAYFMSDRGGSTASAMVRRPSAATAARPPRPS